jgi:hypothetical protein
MFWANFEDNGREARHATELLRRSAKTLTERGSKNISGLQPAIHRGSKALREPSRLSVAATLLASQAPPSTSIIAVHELEIDINDSLCCPGSDADLCLQAGATDKMAFGEVPEEQPERKKKHGTPNIGGASELKSASVGDSHIEGSSKLASAEHGKSLAERSSGRKGIQVWSHTAGALEGTQKQDRLSVNDAHALEQPPLHSDKHEVHLGTRWRRSLAQASSASRDNRQQGPLASKPPTRPPAADTWECLDAGLQGGAVPGQVHTDTARCWKQLGRSIQQSTSAGGHAGSPSLMSSSGAAWRDGAAAQRLQRMPSTIPEDMEVQARAKSAWNLMATRLVKLSRSDSDGDRSGVLTTQVPGQLTAVNKGIESLRLSSAQLKRNLQIRRTKSRRVHPLLAQHSGALFAYPNPESPPRTPNTFPPEQSGLHDMPSEAETGPFVMHKARAARARQPSTLSVPSRTSDQSQGHHTVKEERPMSVPCNASRHSGGSTPSAGAVTPRVGDLRVRQSLDVAGPLTGYRLLPHTPVLAPGVKSPNEDAFLHSVGADVKDACTTDSFVCSTGHLSQNVLNMRHATRPASTPPISSDVPLIARQERASIPSHTPPSATPVHLSRPPVVAGPNFQGTQSPDLSHSWPRPPEGNCMRPWVGHSAGSPSVTARNACEALPFGSRCLHDGYITVPDVEATTPLMCHSSRTKSSSQTCSSRGQSSKGPPCPNLTTVNADPCPPEHILHGSVKIFSSFNEQGSSPRASPLLLSRADLTRRDPLAQVSPRKGDAHKLTISTCQTITAVAPQKAEQGPNTAAPHGEQEPLEPSPPNKQPRSGTRVHRVQLAREAVRF